MHKTTICLVFISLIFLFDTTTLSAAEKKILFNTESLKYETGTGSERCRAQCGRKSGPDAKSLLGQGWKIVSSSAKEVIGEHFSYVPCNTCKPHGCICVGTEYVLQKEEPVPVIDSGSNVVGGFDKNGRSVPLTSRIEDSKHELDLLKKEIDLLKQENASQKQEIESLRNQLRSSQK